MRGMRALYRPGSKEHDEALMSEAVAKMIELREDKMYLRALLMQVEELFESEGGHDLPLMAEIRETMKRTARW